MVEAVTGAPRTSPPQVNGMITKRADCADLWPARAVWKVPTSVPSAGLGTGRTRTRRGLVTRTFSRKWPGGWWYTRVGHLIFGPSL